MELLPIVEMKSLTGEHAPEATMSSAQAVEEKLTRTSKPHCLVGAWVLIDVEGADVVDALILALTRADIAHAPGGEGFVEVRYGLRGHIARHLQRRLINDGYAPPGVRDDFFATDLGL